MTTEERKKAAAEALDRIRKRIADLDGMYSWEEDAETIRELLQPTPKKLNALGFEIPESIHDLKRNDAAVGCVVDVFDAARGNPSQDIGGLFSFFFTHSDMHLIRGCLMEHNKLIRVTPQNREADMPDAETTTDLLPCPFCGGGAEFEPYLDKWANGIACSVCRISTNVYGDKDSAINAWNRRADLANKPALDAEVREALLTRVLKVINKAQKEFLSENKDTRYDWIIGELGDAYNIADRLRAASAVQEPEEVTVDEVFNLIYQNYNEKTCAETTKMILDFAVRVCAEYKIVKERKE